MFKVGDEVLIRGTIERVDIEDTCERPYLFKSKVGFLAWVPESEVELPNKTYTQGLADAWELLKKVYDMKCETIKQIFDVEGGFWNVIKDFTYEEALAKIEAYEREKEIKVGDVVEWIPYGNDGIVTCVRGEEIYVIWSDGSCGTRPKDKLKKTGRTADGLDLLLRQIGE